MTYINKRLPPLSEIKKEYEEMGSEKFINLYIKYEGFIGPVESMEFLKNVFKEDQLIKNNK
jgi:hypothetical protein